MYCTSYQKVNRAAVVDVVDIAATPYGLVVSTILGSFLVPGRHSLFFTRALRKLYAPSPPLAAHKCLLLVIPFLFQFVSLSLSRSLREKMRCCTPITRSSVRALLEWR